MSIVDTKLKDISTDDNFFPGWYIRITSGTEDGVIRQVSTSTGSSGTLTPYTAFPTQIASGVTYELHRHDPVLKQTAISRASSLAFPFLYLPIMDESIIVDDLLSNSDYEQAISSGAHPSWTNTGAGLTVTAETSRVYHGAQSAKLVEGGTGAATISQTPTVNIHEVVGKTATFKRMAWASAASKARVGFDFGGADGAQYGSYHTGDSAWRRISHSLTIPTDATQVKVLCQVAVSATVYYDAGGDTGLFIQNKNKYTLPTSLIQGPYEVLQQYDVDNVNGVFAPLKDYGVPTQGRILRLTGMNYLSQPSTDAGTVEIGEPRVELFIAFAAKALFRALKNRPRGGRDQDFGQLEKDWDEEIGRLMAQPNMKMRLPFAQVPRDCWRTGEDSAGRYLLLTQPR